jgi:hypothetical protein
MPRFKLVERKMHGTTCSVMCRVPIADAPPEPEPVIVETPDRYICEECGGRPFGTSKGLAMHTTKMHGPAEPEPED